MRRASGSPHFVRAGERRIYSITKLPIYQILSESMPSYAKLETKIRVMDGTTTLTPSHFLKIKFHLPNFNHSVVAGHLLSPVVFSAK
jgi:hypothetical protein